MDIKIYVCHHKEGPFFENEFFKPIQVGRAIAKKQLDGMIGDDTGENISEKNDNWCELTAIYWIWKNTNHDFVGINHYRRYLSFADNSQNLTISLDKNIDFLLYCSQNIVNICSSYDIITSPLCNIHQISSPNNKQTAYENYSFNHFESDMNLVFSIIKEKHPEYYEASQISSGLDICFFGNMMLMRRDIFNKYCNFVFSVLFALENMIDTSKYDYYQRRVYGFIAERLSNIFVLKQQLLGGDKKVYHAGQISLPTFTRTYNFSELNTKLGFVNHPAQAAIEILHGGTIHLVISFDDAYMLHAIACIMSILDRASVRDALTFHVIHDERLGSPNISIIKRIFINTKIHFYDVSNDRFPGLLPRNRPHISKNTYYRLIVQDYLPREVSRIIYSDLDTIFLDDIIQLWNFSMDNAILAGCLDEGGLTQSRKLFGKAHNKNYINAGVLLFDMQAAKAKYGNLRFLYAESLAKHVRNITLQDQDLLNISFVDDIIHLPLRWNVGSRIYGNNELDYAYSEADEKIAAENPAVIHFTGENKPWHADSTHPLKSIYLHYQERASQALQHVQR